MKKIGKPILKHFIFQNTALCALRTTNHGLMNKGAEMEWKEEFAFVPEIKAGKPLPENENASFEALFGVKSSQSSVWQG
jgi:hypothetical protein